jgi:hypothetical protein
MREPDRIADAILTGTSSADDRDTPVQRFVAAVRTQAAAVVAPTPTPALARRLALGDPGRRQERVIPMIVVAPSTRRPVVRARTRYAIAAAVGALVISSGLVGAGALPAAIQDPIARALHGVGIDVPGGDPGHPARPGGGPGGPSGAGSAPVATGPSGSGTADGSGAAGGPTAATGSAPLPTAPTLPGVTLVPPTLPPSELPGGETITAPLTLPELTLPPTTLPPGLPPPGS